MMVRLDGTVDSISCAEPRAAQWGATHVVKVSTWILGLVFLLSAYLKAVDERETIAALHHLLGSERLAQPALWALIFIEISLGAALVAGLWPRVLLIISGAALLLFTGWIAYLLISGVDIDCGCGMDFTWLKPSDARWWALGKNVGLLAVSASGLAAIRAVKRSSAERSMT